MMFSLLGEVNMDKRFESLMFSPTVQFTDESECGVHTSSPINGIFIFLIRCFLSFMYLEFTLMIMSESQTTKLET